MKPTKLIMTAFGPYAGTQEIDFRQLDGRSFFLIHGATGSGKTTILDAMCFALYGETSGNDRKGEQMRSQHTKSDIPTAVEFDFALGDNVYRVMRSLKRENTKDPSVEASFKSDKAMLWNRTNIIDEQDIGIEMASKWTKVTSEIETLFGFESTQFRQVIMLPQDKFQQMLKAKSDEREDLFKVLFQTKYFENIENALKQEAAELNKELQSLTADRVRIMQMAHVSTPDELTTQQEDVSIALEVKRGEITNLRALEQDAAKQLTYGQDIHNKIVEREQAETHLGNIELKQAEYSSKQNKLELARRAAELVELENALFQQQVDAETIETSHRNAQTDYEKAIESQQLTADALALEIGRQDQRDEARRERDRLDSFQGQVDELEKARETFKTIQAKVANLEHNRNLTKDKREKILIEREKLEKFLANADVVALRLVALKQASDSAEQTHEQHTKLSNIIEKWKVTKKHEEESEKLFQQVEHKLTESRDHFTQLQVSWSAGQAAVLARQLVDDTPCLVCGSTHHPKPAISTQSTPSDSDIENARMTVESLTAQLQNARADLAKYHDETIRYDAERKPIVELLGEKANLSTVQINRELNEAREVLQTAKYESKHIETAKQQVEPLKMQFSQAEAEFLTSESAYQNMVAQQSAANAVLNERQNKLPSDLNDPGKLDAAKQKADAIIKKLETALKNAHENNSHANKHLATYKAITEQLFEQAANAKRRADEQELKFRERVNASGFINVSDYSQAKLTSQTIMNLDEEIRVYDGQLQAARDRAERARDAAQSLIKPDLERLRTNYQQAQADTESSVRLEEQIQAKLNSIDESRKQLEHIEGKWKQKESEYSVIGKISNVANGENPYKMTFHRFVLSTLLDAILDDATQRLQTMSRGRYILQRAEIPGKGRRIGGLDLVVNDLNTASSRPVETLSGGESFYTSLALALGLREVVQKYAGGIRLDTIFIDEGFGSLDTETLDLAIKTLESLKEGGRLVGIISHVESLHERIPARLKVTSETNGSKAEFVIG